MRAPSEARAINTAPVASADEAGETVVALRRQAADAATCNGLTIAAGGTHPFARPEDQPVVDEARYTDFVGKMLPGFSHDDVVDWSVQRAKLVEPVHELHAGRRLAPVWPDVPRLALASNAQIYPWLLNGNSVMAFSEQVARQTAERLGLAQQVRPAGGD